MEICGAPSLELTSNAAAAVKNYFFRQRSHRRRLDSLCASALVHLATTSRYLPQFHRRHTTHLYGTSGLLCLQSFNFCLVQMWIFALYFGPVATTCRLLLKAIQYRIFSFTFSFTITGRLGFGAPTRWRSRSRRGLGQFCLFVLRQHSMPEVAIFGLFLIHI